MNDFKAGDRVRDLEGAEYTVEDGPQTAYKIRAAGDESRWLPAASLTAVPPTDPRVDVAAKAYAEHVGIRWEGISEASRDSLRDTARAAIAALDAMPKEYPAQIVDRDGDVWTLGKNEEVGDWDAAAGDASPWYRCAYLMNRTYNTIKHSHGPISVPE